MRKLNRNDLVTIFLLFLFPNLYAKNIVTIASDSWCPYTCAQNDQLHGGFLVEVAEKAYSYSHYQVNSLFLPLNRAMKEALQGKIAGVYAPYTHPQMFQSDIISQSFACFYTQDPFWKFKGIDSLKSIRLGAIDEYGYSPAIESYLNLAKKHPNQYKVTILKGDTPLIKLIKGLQFHRMDAIVEHEAVLNYFLGQQKSKIKLIKAGCSSTPMPLFIGFSQKIPLAKKVVDLFNQGLKRIKANGELKKLKTKYQIP